MPTCRCCEMDTLPIVAFDLCTYCYYDDECELYDDEKQFKKK